MPKALIDADSMIYRVAYKAQEATEKEAVALMANYLEGLIYDDLAYCDDYEGHLTKGRCFRYDIAKTAPYKGNRKDFEKPKYYQLFFDYMVSAWGFKVNEYIEADDAVGIAQSKYGIDDTIIVGIDKDLDQYYGEHYNFAKKLRYTVTPHEALMNLFVQCLTGDKADNIQGLRGIGPVKARRALEDCTDQQQMFNKCVEMYEGNAERVNENLSLLYLMRTENDFWKPMEVTLEKK